MARQNFLSKESFVAATEKQVKDSLFCIPAFASNIRFVAENKMIESVRFSYEDSANAQQFFIDVTVLPLNDQYMRISMKGTYVSGKILEESGALAVALHDFESAIDAALKDDVSLYHPNRIPSPCCPPPHSEIINIHCHHLHLFITVIDQRDFKIRYALARIIKLCGDPDQVGEVGC